MNTERLYKIDRLLRERRSISASALRRELGISRATLKRDIADMRDRFNAPIEFDRDLGGYKFGEPRVGPVYQLPGLWFNATEIHALLTALQLLGNLQPGLLEARVAPLADRLRKILGSGDHSWQEVEKRIRILQPGRREAKAQHFSTVAAALLKRQRVHISHYNRERDSETEREVSPQRLVHYRDNWYLDAYCHMRNDLRSFAVDAIREASLLESKAREVAKAELDEYLKSGYGIFAGRAAEWAALRFTAQAARWVSSQTWHSSQRARFEKDGSYVLEVPYADDRELVMEILKFGPDVEVLGPEGLRAKIKAQLNVAQSLYR